MRKLKKINALLLVSSICTYIMLIFMPIFSTDSNIFNMIMFISFILFVVSIVMNRFFDYRVMIAILIIIIFNYFIYKTQWLEYTSLSNKMLLLLEFWYPMIIMAYTFSGKEKLNKENRNFVLYIFILIYTITSITTIIGNLNYDIPSRYLATSTLDRELVLLYKSNNIGGFGFCYMAIFVVPMLIYKYKSSGKKIFLLPLIVTYILCIESQYTILMFLVVLVTFLTSFDSITPQKKILLSGIFILSFILIFINLKEIMVFIINLFEGQESIQKRFHEIYMVLSGNNNVLETTDLSLRQELYQKSIDSFISNPILGSDELGVGEHSELLDLLGSMGIAGVGLLIAFLGIVFRIISKTLYLLNDVEKYHIKIASILMLILSILNPVFSSRELGFVGLIVMLYVQGDKKNIEGEKNEISMLL